MKRSSCPIVEVRFSTVTCVVRTCRDLHIQCDRPCDFRMTREQMGHAQQSWTTDELPCDGLRHGTITIDELPCDGLRHGPAKRVHTTGQTIMVIRGGIQQQVFFREVSSRIHDENHASERPRSM